MDMPSEDGARLPLWEAVRCSQTATAQLGVQVWGGDAGSWFHGSGRWIREEPRGRRFHPSLNLICHVTQSRSLPAPGSRLPRYKMKGLHEVTLGGGDVQG